MARPAKASSGSPKKGKSASPVKRQKRAKKDPNAPKRGKSAYMIWLSENRARLTKPGMSVVDVTKAAGVEWKTIEDKSKWEKLAAKDKERYLKESASYKAAAGGSSQKKTKGKK